jgi:hypothetical protein
MREQAFNLLHVCLTSAFFAHLMLGPRYVEEDIPHSSGRISYTRWALLVLRQADVHGNHSKI